MAKSKRKKIKKIEKTTYRVTAYQIQIKGPRRNEAMKTLLDGLKEKLLNGRPLAQSDKYGTVIRSIKGVEGIREDSLILSLVKYNSLRTGLSWDMKTEELVEELSKVTAQKTELFIFPEEHIAFHIHKTHGPFPSQIEFYLQSIFEREKRSQKMECDIQILPIKVGGEVKKLQNWKSIKKFSIEVIRPNPSGAIRAKRLQRLLDESAADKVSLDLTAKVTEGIKKTSISELIHEGDRLVQIGQGRVQAEGMNASNQKDTLDSKNAKVKYTDILTDSSDFRTLEEIVWQDYYSRRG